MVLRVLGAVALLVGCGRIDFEPHGLDAGTLACTAFGPFGPAQNLGAMNSPADDYGPTLSSDDLELFFTSQRAGSAASDLWYSRRSAMDLAFPPATQLGELNTTLFEGEPTLTGDDLRIYYSNVSQRVIRSARRPDRGSPFESPQIVPLTLFDFPNGPSISPDDLALYFHARIPAATTELDLAVALRTDASVPFESFEHLTELSEAGVNDRFPAIRPDRLEIFFARDTPTAIGDLFTATRTSPAARFDPPAPVGEVNTQAVEGDPVLSSDGRVLTFASDRAGGSGGLDLWHAVRDCQ